MTFARSIRRRLRVLIRSEQGIALPVALFTTIAAMALGGVAVMSSIDVQHGTTRDNGSKSAIAAADAGANVAMQRLNHYGGSLSEKDPCLNGSLQPSGSVAGNPDWCPSIEEEVGGSTFVYQVSAVSSICGASDVCVVSTGTAGGVSRRIELKLDERTVGVVSQEQKRKEEEIRLTEQTSHTESELKLLEEELKQLKSEGGSGGAIAGLVGKEGLTLSGTDYIGFGVGTNGNLVTSGNVEICGDVQVGIGKTWQYSGHKSQCAGHAFTQGNLEVPSVSSFIPSDIATHNSNARLTKCSGGLPAECQKDTYNGTWNGTSPFNPSTRRISLSGSKTLTVGGGDYWLCSLTLSGSQELIMAAGAHVRFFFDTPEHCGTSSQISISGNSKIVSTGYKGTPGQFAMPGFYLLGSPTGSSQVSISGTSSGNEFIVYAPDSTVSVSGTAAKGIVVGKTVSISGTARLEQDEGFEAPPELQTHSQAAEERIKAAEKKSEETGGNLKQLKKELEDLPGIDFSQEGAGTYAARSYVECTGAAAPTGEPDADC